MNTDGLIGRVIYWTETHDTVRNGVPGEPISQSYSGRILGVGFSPGTQNSAPQWEFLLELGHGGLGVKTMFSLSFEGVSFRSPDAPNRTPAW